MVTAPPRVGHADVPSLDELVEEGAESEFGYDSHDESPRETDRTKDARCSMLDRSSGRGTGAGIASGGSDFDGGRTMHGLVVLAAVGGAAEPTTGETSLWKLLAVVCVAGAVGGIANAINSGDAGLVLPKSENGVVRLGFIGNIFMGAIAAGLTWGLYGTAKDAVIIGDKPAGPAPVYSLSVAALIAAVAAGVAGARLVTSEVDKKFFQKAAIASATNPPDAEKAARIGAASPPEALRLALE